MTLKEKFKKLIFKDFTINQLEQIADDYAIEFAVWFIEHKEFNKSKTTKELLEIFKKEKGL